ncbi:MAG: ImmA/IrrE family metallo-endopeptidase [Ilumatobacter sp.]|uniref:ImmA/IrrE family metallo-endopeptidase n=1 Tax=Ilumatobacter sp. TaxID=1967498 RepID=UPI002621885B|nr:ImmA/IrrE family metallo-endopeptidase [Ilumatobacter sp.]MDJ0769422.1 ImmA/IrrE family metallo-endopeptidase [Ilumatobacter sp.]
MAEQISKQSLAPTRHLPRRIDDWIEAGTALRRLRRLFPLRRVTTVEAIGIAERQAYLLLAICGVDRIPVPAELIGELSAVRVVSYARAPIAGANLWDGAGWVIVLDERQCVQHRRSTLAHEFKHIIDAVDRDRYEDVDVAEPLADYFARCLLMPRPWVKAALADGVRDVRDLAAVFDVPVSMMEQRLGELGLEHDVRTRRFNVRRRPRCRHRVCPR